MSLSLRIPLKKISDHEAKINLEQGEKTPVLEAKQEQEKPPKAEDFEAIALDKEGELQ